MKVKLHIKKDDLVKVLAGDSKGQEGKVLSIDKIKNRALVEGVNLVSKHTKPDAKNPQGGIIKKESTIHVSNLMLIEPGTGKVTRVGRKLDEKSNKLVRYSKKTGEVIK
ncbi:MAG TPA: 50S ribosomal protein L24 [Bacteroidia bacterium]|nr:50S ribosomal protein L24 [Bacteroidia bacterium]